MGLNLGKHWDVTRDEQSMGATWFERASTKNTMWINLGPIVRFGKFEQIYS